MEQFPHAKKIESRESKEVLRATLSFDFIFNNAGQKKIYCIEINGEESGIAGMDEIPRDTLDPQQRTLAKIRASETPEWHRKVSLGKQIVETMNDGTFQASTKEVRDAIFEHMVKSIDGEKMFKHAMHNPPAVEALTNHKLWQQEYISPEFRAPLYEEGSPRPQESASGYWIAKPLTGRRGKGIEIISNKGLPKWIKNNDENLERYIIQEFVPPTGADNAPYELKDNAASLRLLIDFIYRADGTIDPLYQAAYQRVSSFDFAKSVPRFHMEDAYVVNKSMGALSFTASEAEVAMAREAAYSIIKNIGQAFEEGDLIDESATEDVG